MPTLLLFAPCEKVIIGQGDNSLSLISVLQTVQVSLLSHPPVEKNAFIASRWFVAVLWQKEPSDGDVEFEQRIALADPAGEFRIDQIMPFQMEKPSHRIVCEMSGFPIFP